MARDSVTVVKTTKAHIDAIKDRLREADVREVWDSHHICGAKALRESWQKSFLSWTGLVKGEPVFCFGVGAKSQLHLKGAPWMLGTDGVEKIKMGILRESKEYIGQMAYHFDMLENWTHATNKVSINWLKWCGFELDDPAPYGPEGAMFRRFWMKKEGV